jgi:hypothetical protein
MGIDDSRIVLIKKFQVENARTLVATGACLIYVPDDSKQYCVEITEEQCKEVGGVFVDGPCPSGTAII